MKLHFFGCKSNRKDLEGIGKSVNLLDNAVQMRHVQVLTNIGGVPTNHALLVYSGSEHRVCELKTLRT